VSVRALVHARCVPVVSAVVSEPEKPPDAPPPPPRETLVVIHDGKPPRARGSVLEDAVFVTMANSISLRIALPFFISSWARFSTLPALSTACCVPEKVKVLVKICVRAPTRVGAATASKLNSLPSGWALVPGVSRTSNSHSGCFEAAFSFAGHGVDRRISRGDHRDKVVEFFPIADRRAREHGVGYGCHDWLSFLRVAR
jgi:hypothetical protein